MKLRRVLLVLAALVVVAFAACTNGNIYATLEREEEILNLSLEDKATFFDVAKITTSDRYFAAAGRIWWVDVADLNEPPDDNEWNKDQTVSGPTGDAMCTALVTSPFGSKDRLFGGFITPEGNLGLYESDNAAVPSFAASTKVAALGDAQIALLTTANDGGTDWLVAVTTRHDPGEAFTYSIWGFDGSTWSEFDTTIRVSPEDQKPFNDIIWSQRFGRWLATGGTKLYMQTGAPGVDSLGEAFMTGITAGEVLTGLAEDATNVYVASKSGAVYYSPSYGSTWQRIAAPEISGVHPPLTRFAGPVDTNFLLLGSEGYGYYLLNTSDLSGSAPLVRCAQAATDNLYYATVLKLFHDGAENRVFACTSMSGLWRGKLQMDGSGAMTWNQE